MRYVFFLGLFLIISSCNFHKETYICDVLELANISPEDEESFGVKNGSTKGTENEYSIKISFNEKQLDFKNLSNGATLSMERLSEADEADGSKVFVSGGYLFDLSKDGKFIFIVNKANYHADYLGSCETVK